MCESLFGSYVHGRLGTDRIVKIKGGCLNASACTTTEEIGFFGSCVNRLRT